MFEEIVNIAYLGLSSPNKVEFEKLEILQQRNNVTIIL